MPRVTTNESMDRKISKAEAKVTKAKATYENALKEPSALRAKQKEIQVAKLIEVMDKSGKSFEEVIRLIKL